MHVVRITLKYTHAYTVYPDLSIQTKKSSLFDNAYLLGTTF